MTQLFRVTRPPRRSAAVLIAGLSVLIAGLSVCAMAHAEGMAPRTLTRTLPGGAPRGLVMTPDGGFLLARTSGGVTLLEEATGRVVQTISASGDGAGLCTDREGDDIFVAGGAAPNPPIVWLMLVKGALTFRTALAVPTGNDPAQRRVTGLAYGPDKAIYVTDTSGGALFKLVGKPRAVAASARIGGRPSVCALSPDGRTLAVADARADGLRLFDPATLRETGHLALGRPCALVWGKDGRLFAADASGSIIHIISGGRVTGTVAATGTATLSALALSRDGRHLYLGAALPGGGGTVLTMDIP